MLSHAVARAAQRTTASTTTSLVARRGFQTTRAQLSSPYHYPEGPYSNLPFNTKTRFFGLRYWSFLAVGFGLPFGIASESRPGLLFLYNVLSAPRGPFPRES
jgi:cytochrome c oxidase subunit 7c